MTSTVRVAAQPVARTHVDALDGIRAVAILMVLAFHFKGAGVPFHGGGFLGVDVFFVLSGFLITSLLLDERRRKHRISLRGFYDRRARRLVPVALVLMLIGAGVFVLAPATYSWRPEPIAFAALAGAWMNWLDIWRPAAGGVLAHTWSLSIEVQFYVVWAPLLTAARAFGVRLRVLAALLLLGIGVAVVLRISAWSGAPPAVPRSAPDVVRYLVGLGRGAHWSRWYFGSFTHMDGLLLGALAGIALTRASVRGALCRHRRVAVTAVGIASVTAAAVAIHAGQVGVSGFVPVWGLLPFEIAVAVVVTVLATVPATRAGRVLGARPMVWIGRRSYAMYMLHIPVWMLFVHFGVNSMPGTPSGVAMAWGAIAVTFLVAAVSYRYLETPVMRRRRRVSPTS